MDMTNANLKTSVAVLALSGCAAEGVPANVSPDAGSTVSGKLDASGPRRGPASRDNGSSSLPEAGIEVVVGADAGVVLGADARAVDDAGFGTDAQADLGSVGVADTRVSDLLVVVLCTALSLAGCDGGIGPAEVPPDLTDAGAKKDVMPVATLCSIPSPTGDGQHPTNWLTVSNAGDSRYLCEHSLSQDTRITACNNGDLMNCPLATPAQCVDTAHDFLDASGSVHGCFVMNKDCVVTGRPAGSICQIVGMAGTLVGLNKDVALCSPEGAFVGWKCSDAQNAFPLR